MEAQEGDTHEVQHKVEDTIDREWAALTARLLAGQRPLAQHLANGGESENGAYVLDWMDQTKNGHGHLAVQVNGSLRSFGGKDAMDVVYDAFDLLSGTVIAGGSGPWFTATLYLPAEADMDAIRRVVVATFKQVGADAMITEVRRVDIDSLRAAMEAAAGDTVGDLDVIAAAFFSEHGFDAHRLTLLGSACAFPETNHACEGDFWRDVHLAFHYGHIGNPFGSANTIKGA